MRAIFLLFMLVLSLGALAQSKKEKAAVPTEAFYPQQDKAPKNSEKKSSKPTYDARDKSFNRLENRWKDREKREKKFTRSMGKDYSIAPYFGHKRPPKIRPVGKRKVCKVCGLTH